MARMTSGGVSGKANAGLRTETCSQSWAWETHLEPGSGLLGLVIELGTLKASNRFKSHHRIQLWAQDTHLRSQEVEFPTLSTEKLEVSKNDYLVNRAKPRNPVFKILRPCGVVGNEGCP